LIPPPAVAAYLRQNRPEHEIGARDIVRKEPRPDLGRQLRDARKPPFGIRTKGTGPDPGIVDQNLDRPEGFADRLDSGSTRRLHRDVADDGKQIAPDIVQYLLGMLDRSRVIVHQRDAVAVHQQAARHRQAQTTRTAGNQRRPCGNVFRLHPAPDLISPPSASARPMGAPHRRPGRIGPADSSRDNRRWRPTVKTP
jgi:hypothetical protein